MRIRRSRRNRTSRSRETPAKGFRLTGDRLSSARIMPSMFLLRTMSARHLRPVALMVIVVAAACGRTDPAIQVAVDEALLANAATASLSVDISVSGGVVRLAGEVTSRDQEHRAVAMAKSVRGVKTVIDGMYLSDAGIVNAVKEALAADPLVARIPIEVDSTRGYVRLMSDQTGPDDRKRAVAIASKVDGVSQVEDRMR